MSAPIEITVELNGRPLTTTVEPHLNLRQLLRREGLFSVKYGSPSGETGAAAILFDGELASADVILAAQADDHAVTTVEVLNTERELHPIQAAFTAVGAFQSGYSAGAMILGTMALLERNPRSVGGRDPRHALRHPRSGDGLREAGRGGETGRCRAAGRTRRALRPPHHHPPHRRLQPHPSRSRRSRARGPPVGASPHPLP